MRQSQEKKKFPRWVGIYTQCVLNGTCYKCPNDRTIYHIAPLSVNELVEVFFERDRATKRKSKYPRRERLILTDNGVGLALEVLFDGLGGLLFFSSNCTIKQCHWGLKKTKKQNKKLDNHSETWIRQGLCHALRLGVYRKKWSIFLIVQLSDWDSIFLSHEGNNWESSTRKLANWTFYIVCRF